MSLVFTDASSNRVDCGSSPSVDGKTAFTALVWFWMTSLAAAQRVLVSKFRGATDEGWQFVIPSSAAELRIEFARATTYMQYASNTTPIVTGQWLFGAATVDQAAGTPGHLYAGSLAAAATEVGYGTSVAGSGAWSDDSARSFFIGNRDIASPNAAPGSRIAIVGYVGRVMPLEEIRRWQFDPQVVPDTAGLWPLGVAGSGTATQPDLSGNGNNGSPTGTSLGEHVPVPTRLVGQHFAALQRAGSW